MFKKFIVLLKIIVLISAESNQIFHVPLDEYGLRTLDWIIDYSHDTVIFEIHVPKNFTWFAFGFSNRGDSFPADYCVLWYNWKGEHQFQDAVADQTGGLHLDNQQDCLNFQSITLNDVVKFTFERKFDTCDADDYIIEDGTTHLVWSSGNDQLYELTGLNVTSPKLDNGMTRVQLLQNTVVNTVLPPNTKTLELLTDRVPVPAQETTYWCHIVKIPEEYREKHHIVQFESAIQSSSQGFVHHMEVFHCEAPVDEEIPLYSGSCFAPERPKETLRCKRVLAAWAMGAKSFAYPQEAGLPIGGPNFNLYLMLEVHYNNPQERENLIDSSGMRLYIDSNLRPMDAGVIELGLEYTDKMAIPPGEELFSLTGYCITECTAVSIPPQGITIFGSQLHTHLTGVRVVTRHVRDGIELPELNRDSHYSPHFQEIRRLKRTVTVLPGDALITTCDYHTVDRENITLGGFAITDEMCVNYVYYFPVIPLEVCKSSISDEGLGIYFKYMHDWEGQETDNDEISKNYQGIKWNKMRIQLLQDVYNETPLNMQCNMSSGSRFPGYWSNSHLSTVSIPLPPPTRNCQDANENS